MLRDHDTYSPHQRGCFQYLLGLVYLAEIFPASAGVFPTIEHEDVPEQDIPRISGGVSDYNGQKFLQE